jgi:hypothetical protein
MRLDPLGISADRLTCIGEGRRRGFSSHATDKSAVTVGNLCRPLRVGIRGWGPLRTVCADATRTDESRMRRPLATISTALAIIGAGPCTWPPFSKASGSRHAGDESAFVCTAVHGADRNLVADRDHVVDVGSCRAMPRRRCDRSRLHTSCRACCTGTGDVRRSRRQANRPRT